jgi:hypothetical protein
VLSFLLLLTLFGFLPQLLGFVLFPHHVYPVFLTLKLVFPLLALLLFSLTASNRSASTHGLAFTAPLTPTVGQCDSVASQLGQ